MLKPRLEGGEDLLPRGALHREDEGKAEAGAVGIVQRREAGKLLGRQAGKPRACLLAGGIVGEVAGNRRLAGEIGMGADEGELCIPRGAAKRCLEGGDDGFAVGEGAPALRGFGNPGRMLGHIAETGDEAGRRQGVDLVDGQVLKPPTVRRARRRA